MYVVDTRGECFMHEVFSVNKCRRTFLSLCNGVFGVLQHTKSMWNSVGRVNVRVNRIKDVQCMFGLCHHQVC